MLLNHSPQKTTIYLDFKEGFAVANKFSIQ